jgi:hypothetical protein
VVNLRLLHPTLPVVIIKKFKNCIKRLFWVVHNIGKCSALDVLEERFPSDYYVWHFGLLIIYFIGRLHTNFERPNFAIADIVYLILEKARTILFRRPLHGLKIEKTKACDLLIERKNLCCNISGLRIVFVETFYEWGLGGCWFKSSRPDHK